MTLSTYKNYARPSNEYHEGYVSFKTDGTSSICPYHYYFKRTKHDAWWDGWSAAFDANDSDAILKLKNPD